MSAVHQDRLVPHEIAPEAMIDGTPYKAVDEEFARAFPLADYIWLDRDGREIGDPAERISGCCFMLTSYEGEVHAYHCADWETGATFYGMGGGPVDEASMIVPEFTIHKRPAAH